jgi:hypothetical protein
MFGTQVGGRGGNTACDTSGACGDFFRTADILFQKSRTFYVRLQICAIADLCGDLRLKMRSNQI